jgi:hypothetical protein
MKLLSAAFIKQIRASFTQYKTTAVAATLNRILVEAEEGNFIYFAKYFDTFYVKDGAGASDGAVLDFFKTLTDDAAVAENATNQFMKALAHTAGAADQINTKAFGKNFQNTSVVQEAYAAYLQKPLSHGFSVADDAAKLHPNKITFDIAGAADEINTFHVDKPLTDHPDVSEFYEASFRKPRADAFGVTDNDTWYLEKPLFDQVTDTDDYVVLFAKKAADDNVGFSESAAKSLQRGFSDAYDVAEKYVSELHKPFSDQVTGIGDYVFLFTKKAPDNPVGFADSINTKGFSKSSQDVGYFSDQINTVAVGKPLADQPVFSDAINTKSTTKQLTDNVFFTDDVDGAASILDDQEMQFVKNTTDVAGVTDFFIIFKNYYRDFVDSAATNDEIYTEFLKALGDTSFASDVIDFANGKSLINIANTSDKKYVSFSKSTLDSATVSEICVNALTKTRLDLASTTDAGSLRSQGYVDFTYFAEDFVGASRTF